MFPAAALKLSNNVNKSPVHPNLDHHELRYEWEEYAVGGYNYKPPPPPTLGIQTHAHTWVMSLSYLVSCSDCLFRNIQSSSSLVDARSSQFCQIQYNYFTNLVWFGLVWSTSGGAEGCQGHEILGLEFKQGKRFKKFKWWTYLKFEI